ncbi:MAG: hypothetical protein G01um101418_138 [Parcubacteria group bacterium Gr01-1014_18]|nr:MAG: hypothetical protein Greene041636_442 [Parcubacteria group bacterium Greene0416_36]TSC81465.1 MAG: hypothetical protein G01um101418_138 [Parcubacteria group bacterium Gr01-1014_18]TSC99063.1 MAG: hypothetical protein Greene101420_419 [Parcubacteria group bacterium Greene1014_20]TSD07256.1 MAG: hypothetical protein Greene07142_272 [Parcubacteria group bacterium Greene0714_2]
MAKNWTRRARREGKADYLYHSLWEYGWKKKDIYSFLGSSPWIYDLINLFRQKEFIVSNHESSQSSSPYILYERLSDHLYNTLRHYGIDDEEMMELSYCGDLWKKALTWIR